MPPSSSHTSLSDSDSDSESQQSNPKRRRQSKSGSGAKKGIRVSQKNPSHGMVEGAMMGNKAFDVPRRQPLREPEEDKSNGEEMTGNPTGDDTQPGGANLEDGKNVKPPSESHTAIASLIFDDPSNMAGVTAGPSSNTVNNSLADDSSNLVTMADSLNMANNADSSNMANEVDSSDANVSTANDSIFLNASTPLSFRALDASGDGESTSHQKEDETESGISEMSDSESEEEDDGSLPLYPSDTDEDADSDEDRRAFAEKHIRNPELKAEEEKLYRFLDETERRKWDEKGLRAIQKYLDLNITVDSTIRRMARTDPTYLPEAATISFTLALHFVTSSEGNIQCGYHAFKNKSTFVRDGWGKKGRQIRGVPGKKRMLDKKKKQDSDVKTKMPDAEMNKPKGHHLRPAKDLGNCGCRVEDIVLEFVLSKSLKIRGMVDGSKVEEMMMGTQDYQEPRDRSFAFEAIRTLVPCFSLNEFFKHDHNEATKDMKIARKQAVYCLDVLNNKYRIHSPDEFGFKELVVISRERLRGLQAKEKRLEKLEGSQMQT